MKKALTILFLLIMLIMAMPCFGANHYVLSTATGAGTGADWTNAYTDLPSSLIRGDTYYIGDGTYGRHSFSDAVDGTKVITIKKSTVADHGTETGYVSTDHDGQAIFTPADVMPTTATHATFFISTSYYVIDGAVDGQGNPDNYGFRVNLHPSYASEEGIYSGYVWSTFYGIGVGIGYRTTPVTDIKILRVATPGAGQLPCVSYASGTCRSDGIAFYYLQSKGGSFNNVEVGYCYSSGHKENFYFGGGANSSLHHSYAHLNTNSYYAHGQNINIDTIDGMLIYDNVVTQSKDFLIAMHLNFGGQLKNIKIYNNVFDGTPDSNLSGGIACMNADADVVKGIQVHHNTFMNIPSLGKGVLYISMSNNTETDQAYAYNNLIYNCGSALLDNSGSSTPKGLIYHDYNAYLASSGYVEQTHDQVDDTADNPLNSDYTINSTTDAANDAHVIDTGKTDLDVLYKDDAAGNERDANPDIGAYEAGASADTTPPTITSATINAAGDTLTLAFPEIVFMNTSTGFTLNMSGGAAGLSYVSGSGTGSWLYLITGRNIDTAETGSLDYVTVADGIEDASGNDLASTGESDIAVTNNSTYSPSATTYTVTPSVSSGGCSISPSTPQAVVSGETKQFTCTAINNFACVAWTGTCGGSGTTTLTTSAITGDCTVIQGCYKIAPDATIGSGAAVTLGSGAVGTLY